MEKSFLISSGCLWLIGKERGETQCIEEHVKLYGAPDIPGIQIEELQYDRKKEESGQPRKVKMHDAE